MPKSPDAFRTISEVAEWLETQAHVLRFWESRFTQIKPVKRAGGRRYYRPADMVLIGGIKHLLHEEGITIKGVQKLLKEKGVKHVSGLSPAIPGAQDDPLAAVDPSADMTDRTEVSDGLFDGVFDGVIDAQTQAKPTAPAATDLDEVDHPKVQGFPDPAKFVAPSPQVLTQTSTLTAEPTLTPTPAPTPALTPATPEKSDENLPGFAPVRVQTEPLVSEPADNRERIETLIGRLMTLRDDLQREVERDEA
jgi:DNA-binding transcriptional MerR regulator